SETDSGCASAFQRSAHGEARRLAQRIDRAVRGRARFQEITGRISCCLVAAGRRSCRLKAPRCQSFAPNSPTSGGIVLAATSVNWKRAHMKSFINLTLPSLLSLITGCGGGSSTLADSPESSPEQADAILPTSIRILGAIDYDETQHCTYDG